METNTIAIVGVVVALTGLGVTLLILLLRGFFRLGQLFQRIDAQDENIREMREDIQQLTAEMRENNRQLTTEMRENHRQLTVDIRQTNEAVVALANHRHDQDGNIILILPTQPGG